MSFANDSGIASSLASAAFRKLLLTVFWNSEIPNFPSCKTGAPASLNSILVAIARISPLYG